MAEAAGAGAAPSAEGERLPREVKGLGAVSLFNDFASEMVYPVLPALITGPLGGGALALGALDGAADLTASAVRVASGRLADRSGWTRPLIAVGYALALLVRPLIAVASAAWQVIAFRMLDRLGKGLRSPARDALLSRVTPVPLRGRAFGLHRGADHLGAVLGSLTAWLMLSAGSDPRSVIAASLVPAVAAIVVLAVVLRWLGRHGERSTVNGKRGTVMDSPSPINRQPSPFPVARSPFTGPLAVLVLLSAGRIPEALLLLRLQEAGVAVAMIPLAWAGLHVVRSVASYPGGVLADRAGVRSSLALGSLVYAGILVLFAVVAGAEGAVAVFLAYGVGAGLVEPAERLAVTRLAPVRTGRAFGIYQGLAGAAALPAGLLFGWMYETQGQAVALVASAVALGVGAVVWWTVNGER
ncbi:MAG: MFS transporter [Gemmatimonadales bacterium]